MPALIPTEFSAEVTWLGLVPDRQSDLCAVPQTELMMWFSGPEGDSHSGLTRPSCSRVTSLHLRGTEIRNVRQLSIVAAEDLQEIAAKIGPCAAWVAVAGDKWNNLGGRYGKPPVQPAGASD